MGSVPLKLKDSADFQNFSSTEENYLAYQVGLSLADADSSTPSALSLLGTDSSSYSVGFLTDTAYDSAVGTGGDGSFLTFTTTTTNLRQTNGTVSISDSDYRLPILQRDSDGQRVIREMNDSDTNALVDRLTTRIFTSDYVGTYRLGSSAPSGDYTLKLNDVMTDTRTDGASLQYNIYQRTNQTAPTQVLPFSIKRSNGDSGDYQGLQLMTPRQIKYSLGLKTKNRIASSETGVGGYKLFSSSAGTPTDLGFDGTWSSKGTATDTRQAIVDANYTRGRVSTYSRLRQSAFSADYTRTRSSAFSQNYTRTRASTYSADYTKTRASNYSLGFIGNFIGNYARTRQTDFTRTRSSVFDYVGNYIGDFTGNYSRLLSYAGNYVGTFTAAATTSSSGAGTKTHTGSDGTTARTVTVQQYLAASPATKTFASGTTFSASPGFSFGSLNNNNTITIFFNGFSYRISNVTAYLMTLDGPVGYETSGGTFVGSSGYGSNFGTISGTGTSVVFTGYPTSTTYAITSQTAGSGWSDNTATVNSSTGAVSFPTQTKDVSYTRTSTRTSTYTRNSTQDFLGNYTRTLNYLGNYTGNFLGEYTRDSQRTRPDDFARNFIGDYAGEFTRTRTSTYARTRGSTYIGDYIGNFTGDYLGNFAGNYIGNYVGAAPGTFNYYTGAESVTYWRIFRDTNGIYTLSVYWNGSQKFSYGYAYSSQAEAITQVTGPDGKRYFKGSTQQFTFGTPGGTGYDYEVAQESGTTDYTRNSVSSGAFVGNYLSFRSGTGTPPSGTYGSWTVYDEPEYPNWRILVSWKGLYDQDGISKTVFDQTYATEALRDAVTSVTGLDGLTYKKGAFTANPVTGVTTYQALQESGDFTRVKVSTRTSLRTSTRNSTVTSTQNFTGNYSRNFVGNYSRNFLRTRSSNFLGGEAFSRNFLGNYIGNYSRNFSLSFEGNYSRNFAGNYQGNYLQDYIGDYSRTFTGNYAGNTIGAGNTNIETYTLYVRIA